MPGTPSISPIFTSYHYSTVICLIYSQFDVDFKDVRNRFFISVLFQFGLLKNSDSVPNEFGSDITVIHDSSNS